MDKIKGLDKNKLYDELIKNKKIIMELNGEKITLIKDDFEIIEQEKTQFARAEIGDIILFLDTKLTTELKSEGFVREILELQSESPGIFDGDIFMYNEPSIGGIHACDQWTGTPIFYEGELICWLGSLTHTAETGAIEPGGMPPSSRSLLHEGYRVQGIKIQDKGKLNQASLNCVLRSTRDPAYYTLDLRARIAGVNVGKQRVKELIARYGVEKVKALIQQNMDYSEELARAKLRSLADGTWRAVAYGDWDVGPEPRLWKISLTATKVKVHRVRKKLLTTCVDREVY